MMNTFWFLREAERTDRTDYITRLTDS